MKDKTIQHLDYRPDIDGLRGIAVLSVLFFHLKFSTFSGGFVGVDVFFVISGFLITRLIVREVQSQSSFKFGRFYLRRARRLLPALIVTLVGSWLLAFLLFSPEHFQRFGGALLSAVLSISNFYFWGESGYFDTSIDFKPLLHTWSLGVEEQFYLLWPMLLVFLLIKFKKPLIPLFIACCAIASLLLNFVFANGGGVLVEGLPAQVADLFSDGAATIFFLTPFRVFELGIGALMVWGVQYQLAKNLFRECMVIMGLLMIAYGVFGFDETTLFPSYNALIPCIGTAMIIFAGTTKYSGSLLNNRVLVGIGLISYSLYLVHWPVIVFYQYYQFGLIDNVERGGIVVAALLFAALMYRFVEQPFRMTKVATVQKRFIYLSVSSMLVLVVVGAQIWLSDGWAWRISEPPQAIKAQLNDSRQFHRDQYGGRDFNRAQGWIYGKDKADIVLIGDSHSQHYAHGLNEIIGKEEGKNTFYTSASCLLIPDFTRNTSGADWDKICQERLAIAIRMINQNPHAVLVLSEFWLYQLSVASILGVDDKLVFDEKDPKSFGLLFEKLDKLKALIGDRSLIIIGNVPGAGVSDVIGCYTRPTYIASTCRGKLGVTQDKGAFNLGNQLLLEYTQKRENTYFFDPYKALCKNGFCKAVENDILYYSDGYHLSLNGSLLVVNDLRPLLLKVMNHNRVDLNSSKSSGQ